MADGKTWKFILAAVLCVLILLLILVGWPIAIIVISAQGKEWTSMGTACPSLPGGDFSCEKAFLKQWHWTYEVQQWPGSFRMNCPTFKRDVGVYYNDELVARSDGKVLTTRSTTYIRDCHGTVQYVMEAGSAWDAFINSFNIKVSLLLWDATQSNILAYVTETNLFTSNIQVRSNVQGAYPGGIVGNIQRNDFSSFYTWIMTTAARPANITHWGGDPAFLMVLAGGVSFNDGDKSDACNQFWLDGIIILSIIGGLILIGGIVFVVYRFRKSGRCGGD